MMGEKGEYINSKNFKSWIGFYVTLFGKFGHYSKPLRAIKKTLQYLLRAYYVLRLGAFVKETRRIRSKSSGDVAYRLHNGLNSTAPPGFHSIPPGRNYYLSSFYVKENKIFDIKTLVSVGLELCNL